MKKTVTNSAEKNMLCNPLLSEMDDMDQKYKKWADELSRLCSLRLKDIMIKFKRQGPAGIHIDRTGNRIKTICLERGFTAKRLQKELNISFQSIYAWFAGKSLPSLDNIYELSSILGVPIDQMIVGTEREVRFFVHFGQTDQQRSQKIMINYFAKLQKYDPYSLNI